MAGFGDIRLPRFPASSKTRRLTGRDAEGLARVFSARPAAPLRKGYIRTADLPGFIEEAREVFTSFLSN